MEDPISLPPNHDLGHRWSPGDAILADLAPHDDLAHSPLEGLVSLINKLQRACTALADQGEKSALPADWGSLPSIAFVGGQGSGKSSVLESMVGIDFLPRGAGIVTRRPLVLQLRRINETGEYAEFLHQPGKRYKDFAEVRKEIADETDRETGFPKRISSVPIHLNIFSPTVVNLTLIDLPGLTKIPVDGQSAGTVQEIENMVRAFIEKPNCIILAVSSVDQDLATSDAIKISQEVDPEGARTFGVLTKLDLLDEGISAVNILEGRSYPLQFRWTGVINRTQEDIDKGLDISAAMHRERVYFANSPEYKHLAHRMGTEHLAKSLSKHLESAVKLNFAGTKLLSDCDVKFDNKMIRLQGYTLRSYGSYPLYQQLSEGPPHDIRFRCSVQVGDHTFSSSTDHPHLKEAKEDAASVAYKAIFGEDSLEVLLNMINEAGFPLVSTLKEYTVKKNVSEPLFASSKVHETGKSTLWLSTVNVDGKVYIGESASGKQLSAQKAALAAITALVEDGEISMLRVVQGKRLVNAVPSKLRKSARSHRRKRRKLT